ncbi:hypothetical protein C9439_05230 [archaeon SCG-AAA382B04]|nr:hypothetical protein C9439_05230 [archaeon SCG-AAA382B04]
MVATAGNEDIDCQHFEGFEEYNNQPFVVCNQFGEIPLSTCESCPENQEDSGNNQPEYIL